MVVTEPDPKTTAKETREKEMKDAGQRLKSFLFKGKEGKEKGADKNQDGVVDDAQTADREEVETEETQPMEATQLDGFPIAEETQQTETFQESLDPIDWQESGPRVRVGSFPFPSRMMPN